MTWTDERIDRLKAMWAEGSTASQIAEELGGVSRNAVIGKAHRLGLESRPSPVKAGEEKAKKAKADAARPPRRPRPSGPSRRPSAAAPRPRPKRGPRRSAEPIAADDAPVPMAPRRGQRDRQGRHDHPVSLGRPRRLHPPGPGRHAGADPARPAAPPGAGQADAPRSPTRPACSTSTTASAAGRWAIRASPISISAASDANPGFPYCVDHCGVAYQAQLPRRDRRPPPPLPFGGPRVR